MDERQKLIIRQSSLKSAVEYCSSFEGAGVMPSSLTLCVEEVLKVASKFESWVNRS